jgi:hypothetical protein
LTIVAGKEEYRAVSTEIPDHEHTTAGLPIENKTVILNAGGDTSTPLILLVEDNADVVHTPRHVFRTIVLPWVKTEKKDLK